MSKKSIQMILFSLCTCFLSEEGWSTTLIGSCLDLCDSMTVDTYAAVKEKGKTPVLDPVHFKAICNASCSAHAQKR